MSYIFNLNGQRPYTDEEDAYIREHKADSLEDLAKALDRSKESVKNHIYMLGLHRKNSPKLYRNDIIAMAREGKTPSEIADALGLVRDSVWYYLRKNGLPVNKINPIRDRRQDNGTL